MVATLEKEAEGWNAAFFYMRFYDVPDHHYIIRVGPFLSIWATEHMSIKYHKMV